MATIYESKIKSFSENAKRQKARIGGDKEIWKVKEDSKTSRVVEISRICEICQK